MTSFVTIVGAGLAGSEAAWQVRRHGIPVRLYEMRPEVMTPAHKSGEFAELVCSNSLGSTALKNASGLLKEELRLLGSMVIGAAVEHSVPAGGALAVDRWGFARSITAKVSDDPGIEVIRQEVTSLPETKDSPLIIATGPLTSEPLARSIAALTGQDYLYFYDAASPIVSRESVDMGRAFFGSRYGRGQAGDEPNQVNAGDYINCPMNEAEYSAFYDALIRAESAVKHDFEAAHFFEGCLPVEEIAKRGVDTLRYGPMKPVGLVDPQSGERPYAVVQLRQDDREGNLYNIVGFQTSLKWGEQDRVLRLIPALRNAEFMRFGVMHRNTYLHGPSVLLPTMQTRAYPGVFFAGQMVGVEGYVESTAMGLIAGLNSARLVLGEEPQEFPKTSMIGALASYVATSQATSFQPMNSNWGLLPPVETHKRGKRHRNEMLVERALNDVRSILRITE